MSNTQTELPPRPSPEQVQAAHIWLERAQQDTDMWLNAMDVLFAWTKAHHRRVQDNDCSSAEILAAELAHVREELRLATEWRPAYEATDHDIVFASYSGVYTHWYGRISGGRFYPSSQFGHEPFEYFIEIKLPLPAAPAGKEGV